MEAITQWAALLAGPAGAVVLAFFVIRNYQKSIDAERARNQSLTDKVIELAIAARQTSDQLRDAIKGLPH